MFILCWMVSILAFFSQGSRVRFSVQRHSSKAVPILLWLLAMSAGFIAAALLQKSQTCLQVSSRYATTISAHFDVCRFSSGTSSSTTGSDRVFNVRGKFAAVCTIRWMCSNLSFPITQNPWPYLPELPTVTVVNWLTYRFLLVFVSRVTLSPHPTVLNYKQNKLLGPQSASELYRLSDRQL
jgi:hypothetical protein